jgi:hypothetical protein
LTGWHDFSKRAKYLHQDIPCQEGHMKRHNWIGSNLDEIKTDIPFPSADCKCDRNEPHFILARTALSRPLAYQLVAAMLGYSNNGSSAPGGSPNRRARDRGRAGIAEALAIGEVSGKPI